MSELTKFKKSQTANRNVVNMLVTKVTDLTREQYNKDIRLDVEVILHVIRAKENLIQKNGDDILDILEEDKIDEDVQEATKFGRDTTGLSNQKFSLKKFCRDPTSLQQF